MSSTRYSRRRCSATRRPSRVLSLDESCSGSSSANTRSRPKARAASAAHTELSMPPETATTTPRRRSTRPTISTRRALISAVSAAQSMSSTDASSAVSGARAAKLALQVMSDAIEAVQVVRNHLVLVDLDAVGLLEVGDQLEHAGRVDHVLSHEGVVVAQVRDVPAHEEVGADVLPYLCLDRFLRYLWLDGLHVHPRACRLILPLSVFGRPSTNST